MKKVADCLYWPEADKIVAVRVAEHFRVVARIIARYWMVLYWYYIWYFELSQPPSPCKVPHFPD